jgi:SAM-dependent methyltransferase
LQLVRKPRVFADYLLHRYANPSFLAAVSLMPILEPFLKGAKIGSAANGLPPRVLDLGCGAGHSSFLLTVLFPHVAITASDQDFVSLYLAKRFLAPNAEYVCSDVEVPSPFPDSYFDAVHCLDAFHYFRSKMAIVGELRRVLKRDAVWVFPHLHNALADNVTAGTPLSPEHYARCFEFLDPTLFDEADLLRHTGEIRRAPRSSGAAVARLRGAQTVALVGGVKDPLDAARPLRELVGDAGVGLRINPIYQGRWRGDTLRLELRWPNERLHEECRAADDVLPRECELTKSQVRRLRGAGGAADDPQIRELTSRFVLVPLPRNYSRDDFTAADRPVTS